VEFAYFSSPRVLEALLSGLKETVRLTAWSSVLALFVGVVVASARAAGPGWIKAIGQAYVLFLRNVPLLIQLFFWYFGLIIWLPATEYPFVRHPDFAFLVAALTIASVMGAFVAEIIRAGLEAVSAGQMEAAVASGLSRFQAYRCVVVPQLVPVILPGLGNEFVNVLKGTTFAMTIGVAELMWNAQHIESETFRGLETMTAITLMYFALAAVIIGSFRALERVVALPGQR
jgi:His/Glu/Gln/Arg/opine family amino acid ABC transporter permease subunit